MKIYDVIISDAALAMFDAQVDFLARVSKNAAAKLMNEVLDQMNEVLDQIDSLSENPVRYPFYDNQFITGGRYRRMVCARRYLVLYEGAGDAVYADYILDCRQDNEWLLL